MASLLFTTVTIDDPAMPVLNHFIENFSKEYNHQVVVSHHDWEVIWRELVNTGIYHRGSDIAEVGTTWLESLVTIQALRPFSPEEVRSMGGSEVFIPALWQQTTVGDDKRIWAIPYRTDVRVLCYWKDMVESAGVNPDVDFQTPEKFSLAMEKLAKVTSTPWAVSTNRRDRNTVHTITSWLWANGGDFVTKDGKTLLFNLPEARSGLFSFFGLHPFMPKDKPSYDQANTLDLFANRQTAVALVGPWIKNNLKARGLSPVEIENIGFTLPPGPPFVGGSVLVIWQHSRVPRESLDFVRFMTRPETQSEICPPTGMLPVRHDNWSRPPYSKEEFLHILYEALLKGRSLPAAPLWGMIEEKVLVTLSRIWTDILSAESPNVESIVGQHLDSLEETLNLALQG